MNSLVYFPKGDKEKGGLSISSNDLDDLVYRPQNIKGEEPDMVNHPKHYNMYSFEVIDLIKEVVKFFPIEIVYQVGNVLKYILRSPFKGNIVQDLEKAVYYLNDAIKTLKEGKEND